MDVWGWLDFRRTESHPPIHARRRLHRNSRNGRSRRQIPPRKNLGRVAQMRYFALILAASGTLSAATEYHFDLSNLAPDTVYSNDLGYRFDLATKPGAQ